MFKYPIKLISELTLKKDLDWTRDIIIGQAVQKAFPAI
jgi:hypothetical protein